MSQVAQVYAHLKKAKLTSMQAFSKFQITRLADVIFKLRGQGYDIETIMLDGNGTKYAQYKLNKAKE
jgi:hypothetical protein